MKKAQGGGGAADGIAKHKVTGTGHAMGGEGEAGWRKTTKAGKEEQAPKIEGRSR